MAPGKMPSEKGSKQEQRGVAVAEIQTVRP